MQLLELVVLKAVQGLRFSKIKAASFSALYRLLRNNGYKHVLCAEKVADQQLKVFFSKNDIENSRLGIITSKRNFPKAVERNQIKRIIRETFRQHTIKAGGVDLVVLVKKAQPENKKVNSSNLNNLFGQVESKCAN